MSPTDRIEHLTDAQRAALESYRDAWLGHGLSTEPADRPRAERAWRAMYAALRKPPPVFLWFDGPATATLARDAFLTGGGSTRGRGARRARILRSGLGKNLGASFRYRLWGELEKRLENNLKCHLGYDLLGEIRSAINGRLLNYVMRQLGNHLEPTLGSFHVNLRDLDMLNHYSLPLPDFYPASLWDDLSDEVWARLWANLDSSLGRDLGIRIGDDVRIRASLREIVGNRWVYWDLGQHEAHRAFYLWPHVALRPMHAPKDVRQLEWWLELSIATGWWEPFEHAVIACERPRRQAVDAQGHLHHDTGPALLCRDGWPVHAVHGVRVPGYVVEQPIHDTFAKIDAQPNAEVRRVMIDRVGIERYVAQSGFRRVHADEFGVLYRRRNRDGRVIAVVRVEDQVSGDDGSPKVHFLWVNDELRPMRMDESTGQIEYGEPQALTARNAVASTFGLYGTEYNPALQT